MVPLLVPTCMVANAASAAFLRVKLTKAQRRSGSSRMNRISPNLGGDTHS